MDYSVKGHRALVTGSSRGIGSAIALELAKGGADVIVHCSHPSDKAEKVAEEIRAMGQKATVLTADLTDPAQVRKLAAECGAVDILVLNASLQIKKNWKEITEEDLIRQMNCNYYASILLMQAFEPAMEEMLWGRIVTIGSVQDLKPHPEMLVYSSSKCAQMGLVRSLAGQLAPKGITVNNVAPGVIYTDRNKEALADAAYAAKVSAMIPAGFYGTKEDIAGTVRLLCSDFGRYIIGQSIYVDGGKSL